MTVQLVRVKFFTSFLQFLKIIANCFRRALKLLVLSDLILSQVFAIVVACTLNSIVSTLISRRFFAELLKYSFYSNVYKQDFTPLQYPQVKRTNRPDSQCVYRSWPDRSKMLSASTIGLCSIIRSIMMTDMSWSVKAKDRIIRQYVRGGRNIMNTCYVIQYMYAME